MEDVLLFDKAEGNIPDNAKIAKLVENYRRALIMHTYQEELVNQKLANEISDEEISTYYEKNKELFHTEHPFVKGLFIKVPLHSQDLDKCTQMVLKKITGMLLRAWKNTVCAMR